MVSSPTGKSLRWLALAGLSLALLGCPDTEGEFNEFDKRWNDVYGGGSGGNAAGTCTPADVPDPGEIDGAFVFALSAGLDRGKPVLLHLDLTSSDDGAGGLQFSFTLQPLNKYDRSTLVGGVSQHGPYAVEPADGSFVAALGVITVPGEGNPFSSNELVADAILHGVLCRPGDFICGDVTGEVTAPIPYELPGSTFAWERLPDPPVYPDRPKIDCAQREAGPPPPVP